MLQITNFQKEVEILGQIGKGYLKKKKSYINNFFFLNN